MIELKVPWPVAVVFCVYVVLAILDTDMAEVFVRELTGHTPAEWAYRAGDWTRKFFEKSR